MTPPAPASPQSRYRREIADGLLLPDPEQAAAVAELERVYRDVCRGPAGWPKGQSGLFSALHRKLRPAPAHPPPRGAYLWGSVGRGKTHLMNGFYESLPFEHKLREHFHRFMQRIHAQLRRLNEPERPLDAVAASLAHGIRVLCLDELNVSDIGDAMLLGGLLDALFKRGVTLVTTSNVAPDELYRDGLQRSRFIPAIEALKRHTAVIAVQGDEDHRLRALQRAEIYHHPLNAAARVSLQRSFASLNPESRVDGGTITVLGRPIATEAQAEGIVWFGFDQICDGPRGVMDYIEIARCYHTVFISGVPVIGPRETDRALRFITLIDELYDRNVNLIISAAAAPGDLYPQGRRMSEFRRTVSRLEEMRSHAYLARRHLP